MFTLYGASGFAFAQISGILCGKDTYWRRWITDMSITWTHGQVSMGRALLHSEGGTMSTTSGPQNTSCRRKFSDMGKMPNNTLLRVLSLQEGDEVFLQIYPHYSILGRAVRWSMGNLLIKIHASHRVPTWIVILSCRVQELDSPFRFSRTQRIVIGIERQSDDALIHGPISLSAFVVPISFTRSARKSWSQVKLWREFHWVFVLVGAH